MSNAQFAAEYTALRIMGKWLYDFTKPMPSRAGEWPGGEWLERARPLLKELKEAGLRIEWDPNKNRG